MNGPKFLSVERGRTGVLIVEADAQIHPLLQLALEPHGYDVKFATHFRDGLEIFERNSKDIAVLLIGGSILGTHAHEILPAFQILKPQLTLLVMTGDIGSHNPQELFQLGVVNILKKPFSMAELIAILESVPPAEHKNDRNRGSRKETDTGS